MVAALMPLAPGAFVLVEIGPTSGEAASHSTERMAHAGIELSKGRLVMTGSGHGWKLPPRTSDNLVRRLMTNNAGLSINYRWLTTGMSMLRPHCSASDVV